jgi:hypothetical protein
MAVDDIAWTQLPKQPVTWTLPNSLLRASTRGVKNSRNHKTRKHYFVNTLTSDMSAMTEPQAALNGILNSDRCLQNHTPNGTSVIPPSPPMNYLILDSDHASDIPLLDFCMYDQWFYFKRCKTGQNVDVV